MGDLGGKGYAREGGSGSEDGDGEEVRSGDEDGIRGEFVDGPKDTDLGSNITECGIERRNGSGADLGMGIEVGLEVRTAALGRGMGVRA